MTKDEAFPKFQKLLYKQSAAYNFSKDLFVHNKR
jgi:hypothetical protein